MLEKKRLFLLDIDGTISIDGVLIEGALEFLESVLRIGGKYIFITNNVTSSIKQYIEQFEKMNIKCDESNLITASYATSLYLKNKYKNKKIFVMGARSFINELKKFEINITEEIEEDIVCAVAAYDTELTYGKIETICELLTKRKDIDYIATNPDLVCPTNFGFVPDCGSICMMIENAVKRKPVYIGKPNDMIIDICLEKNNYQREETLLIGDRLYTDIACGINGHIDTCLVLSGEAEKKDLKHTEFKPDYVFKSLKELGEEIRSFSKS